MPALFNGIVNPIDPDGAGLASGYHSKVDGANQNSGSTITFNPGIPIPPGATVGIWGAEQGNYQGILVNGKSQAGYNTSYSAQLVDWTATLAGDTEITSISCTIANNPGEVSAISGIVINGYLLGGNYNNIGVDASGNGNDFTDQGFAVGDTSEVWSATPNPGAFAPDNGIKNLFDGTVGTTYAQSNTGGARLVITFPSPITGRFEISTTGLDNLWVNGVSVTTPPPPANSWDFVDFGDLTDVTMIELSRTANKTAASAIKVDGVLLVDANVQDTVLDTPMNSYAVLETGDNGNLEAIANGTNVTYMGEAGTDYYYEVDGSPAVHTGGTAFSSASAKVYNFGQQPFASQFDTSQVWSSTLTASTSFEPGKGANKAFNGILDDQAQTTGADSYMEWDVSSYGFTGIVTWWVGGTTEVYYDGTKVAGGSGTGYNPNVANLPIDGISVVKFARPTANSYPLVSGVEINGKILVDTDAAIAEAYGNNLVQTWAEWNGVTELRFDNPDSVAKYDAIVDSFSNYHSERLTFRNNLRLNLRAAGYDGDQLYHVLCD